MFPFVIMMTGTSLSLKTTTAKRLVEHFDIPWIDSSAICDFPSFEGLSVDEKVEIMDNVRAYRHKKMKEMFCDYLSEKKSFLIDSGFSTMACRREYYEMLGGYRLCLLWCHCDDLGLVRERLDRRVSGEGGEPTFTNWDAILSARKRYESPVQEVEHLVDFDTGKFSVNVKGRGDFVWEVGRVVKEIV